ncbi:hypothetical protein RKE29_06950 [Streptomyces sp. B1866]|uniref:DUF7848 domain-containing protein n=1 Tax=Streptomyces sp. B1866 TaxID=3075431 RepID=UPI00288D3153|nr:hypothetical protein [Streptomyces sp. B1866]MDT3396379.1 hypothetical protein [Streptomyces sp. B1866]
MTRAVYRFREFTIGPDQRPDAEPVRFAMECAACGSTGPRSEDADAGTAWAVAHLRANPEHLAYREHVTRPYRFEAGAWQ